MKKTLHSKFRIFIIIIATVLIIFGVNLTVRMFNNYGRLILQNTDNQLISLARSVDRNVDSQLERYTENLAHTMEDSECKDIENQWLADDMADGLLRNYLKNSLLGQDEKVADVLLLVEEEVLFSKSGDLGYRLLTQNESESEMAIGPCINENGTIYIAIVRREENRAAYAVLIDLAAFYEEITANLSAELQNEIIMMDAGEQALIHRQGGGVVVDQISHFSENDSKFSMLEFLLAQQKEGEEGTDFCDAVSSATGKAYKARMAVVPATEKNNGVFTIGVSTDYDEMTRPMRYGSIQLITYGGMALLGVICLVIMLLHAFRGNERALREVELLKAKNAAMEELNRQTQEFAHHQRLELMGTITSGIAHEFNNLLAPIMGYSILVLEKLPPEENELYDEVLEIYNTSIKAKTVVSRLQDLSRKNANTGLQKLELDEVVRKSVEIVTPAKPKTVELKLDLKGQGLLVMGNETQLSQLLLNLIINAFHATEEKGGEVIVSTEVEEKKLLLKVADNGYGISKEVMERIFEPFFTTKKGGKGTGLGLAIVEQVVEDHGGAIKVDSKEGVGTAFLVELPIFLGES